jgi:dTDP-4-dehydrorhamnose 3,5-epimerase
MDIVELQLEGCKLITPKIFRDDRGLFFESYREPSYREHGIGTSFVQDNHSESTYGTIRGMHFQSFPGQDKLIRVGRGKIFDVVVDIRPNSPTFGEWEGVILDDHDHQQLFVPAGFAHGFCVLSDFAQVFYKVSAVYNPKTEMGFRWDDPDIKILWPVKNPTVSERDRQAPKFKEINWQNI